MPWTDERTELLKKLWSEGLSVSQIAERLGGVTRNSVIGKAHRLSLSGRVVIPRTQIHRPRIIRSPQKPKSSRQKAFKVPCEVRELPVSKEELVIPLEKRKYIATLTDYSCRWPIGDPQSPDFHFCGGQKVKELPYCEFHARRAFQPPKKIAIVAAE